MLKKLRTYLNDLTLRAYVRAQIFAAQEPVRLRAALTSLALAGAVFVPGLAQEHTASMVGGVAAVVLPVLVGENARRKVTPTE
ncbi:hypothetical protein SAM23877_6123 [Streptomyces ambofaciens ATCC 23877]|uniref:Integral membrane protein n=1 Tax=Streptomyces ambofaciens (strain ATCC 23877 / 3486 / DSM 40053 / JCM 4204 / NBRC 12836 / NRRL B-2516) TaxID=278992 RepID=A0A0K2B1T5_STRA7|nr:hypothetical protein [Streptomyces ambofaciens]AKZ59168.1 hypothetical protein SAM23877_6123 [Streptomyces ambofaciens ATCC 23877]WNA15361.1 minor tail protein [Streptomyces phage Samy]